MKLAALLFAIAACHSGTPGQTASPSPRSAVAPPAAPSPKSPPSAPPKVDWNKRFGDGPTIPTTGVTFADPKQSSQHVGVFAKLVGVDPSGALCGIVHWGSLVEYEVVSVESGNLDGQPAGGGQPVVSEHFLAVVGCIDMPRTSYDTNAGTLQTFHIGDTHRLMLSTSKADSRGMTEPPPAMKPPFFYLVSADPG